MKAFGGSRFHTRFHRRPSRRDAVTRARLLVTSDEATGDARGVTNSPHVASGCRCGIRHRVGCRCSAFSPPSCTRCVECSLAQFSPFSLYYKVSCFTYGFHSDFHTHACSDLRSGGRPKVTVCCGRRRAFHTFCFHCEFHHTV